MYLGTGEGDFKKQFYNHRKSFNNEPSPNNTTILKYIWELKETSNLIPTLVWSIAKKKYHLIQIYPRGVCCAFRKTRIN